MRVLLCRPRPDAERMARTLAERGHEAIVAPVLEIRKIDPDLGRIGAIDALVMTSLHAAASIDDSDVTRWAGLPVYAVGSKTAGAARARGFADVRVGAGDASALADLVRLTCRPGGRLLFLAGTVRKPELETALDRAGYRIEVAETYEAGEAPGWTPCVRSQLSAGSVDACLHFSHRSAALALRYAGEAGAGPAFARLHNLCLSDDVAAPLLEAGLADVTVAARPTEAALFALLEGLTSHPRG